jgi:hypothetical protein
MAWVCERTIQTEQLLPIDEVSANFCRERVPRGRRDRSLQVYSRVSIPVQQPHTDNLYDFDFSGLAASYTETVPVLWHALQLPSSGWMRQDRRRMQPQHVGLSTEYGVCVTWSNPPPHYDLFVPEDDDCIVRWMHCTAKPWRAIFHTGYELWNPRMWIWDYTICIHWQERIMW